MNAVYAVRNKNLSHSIYDEFRFHLELKEAELVENEIDKTDESYRNFSVAGLEILDHCIYNIFYGQETKENEAKLFDLLFSKNEFCLLAKGYAVHLFELKVIGYFKAIKSNLISFDDIKDIIEDCFITSLDKLKNDSNYRELCISKEKETFWTFYIRHFNLDINSRLGTLIDRRERFAKREFFDENLLHDSIYHHDIIKEIEQPFEEKRQQEQIELIDTILKFYTNVNSKRNISIFKSKFLPKAKLSSIAKDHGMEGDRAHERVRQIINMMSDFIERFRNSEFLKDVPERHQLKHLRECDSLKYITEFRCAKTSLLKIISENKNGLSTNYQHVFKKICGEYKLNQIWDYNYTHLGPSEKILKLLSTYLEALQKKCGSKKLPDKNLSISKEDKEYLALNRFAKALKNYLIALKKLKEI